MVDVTSKPSSLRTCVAEGFLRAKPATTEMIFLGELKKGDALATAKIAGIQAAKETSRTIPLCHPLPLEYVDIRFEKREDGIRIESEVRTTGKTGVEMEALCAVAAAGLTLYDMAKAIEKSMCLTEIALVKKTGGKSGTFLRKEQRD